MAVFHAFTSPVNSPSKKALILWDMGVVEEYPVSSEVYDKSELSRIKAKESVISHLCRHTNNSPRRSVYLNFFWILLWMCRNNSHASKYCQDLQNSYVSIVSSVS